MANAKSVKLKYNIMLRTFLVGQHGVSSESNHDALVEAIKTESEDHVFDTYIPEGAMISVVPHDYEGLDETIFEIEVIGNDYNDNSKPFDCYIPSQGQILYTNDHGLFGAQTLRELTPGKEIYSFTPTVIETKLENPIPVPIDTLIRIIEDNYLDYLEELINKEIKFQFDNSFKCTSVQTSKAITRNYMATLTFTKI